ncbi:MAG: RCC1 domain-containing protein, partial [Defluviitaleaceae bacterium]|nr:RCC1 domain-containing protein [Defluviitaleaceae bacterium]
RYGYLSVEDRELKYEYLFYYDRTVEPTHKEIISDNEQLVEEADNAFPAYDYTDNILEMYELGDFSALDGEALSEHETAPTPESPALSTHHGSLSIDMGHSAAILADGTLWTWGFNGHGQLGNVETTKE